MYIIIILEPFYQKVFAFSEKQADSYFWQELSKNNITGFIYNKDRDKITTTCGISFSDARKYIE